MRKTFMIGAVGFLALTLLCGCLILSVGNKNNSDGKRTTIEQQLNDLEKARKSGAITQEQYDTQRTKLLENQ